MKMQFYHFSSSLLLICCICLMLAGCGENSSRKFAKGFRELEWHMPLKELPGPQQTIHPQPPLFPFEAQVIVRKVEASSLGHIPVVRYAYAFTKKGFQAVRVDFLPEFLVPVRHYFQDSYGKPEQKGDSLQWNGYGVRIKLYPTAPDGPFAIIEGPQGS